MKNTIEIVVWPDGDWCEIEYLKDYDFKSDDYTIKRITEEEYEILCDSSDDYTVKRIIKPV